MVSPTTTNTVPSSWQHTQALLRILDGTCQPSEVIVQILLAPNKLSTIYEAMFNYNSTEDALADITKRGSYTNPRLEVVFKSSIGDNLRRQFHSESY